MLGGKIFRVFFRGKNKLFSFARRKERGAAAFELIWSSSGTTVRAAEISVRITQNNPSKLIKGESSAKNAYWLGARKRLKGERLSGSRKKKGRRAERGSWFISRGGKAVRGGVFERDRPGWPSQRKITKKKWSLNDGPEEGFLLPGKRMPLSKIRLQCIGHQRHGLVHSPHQSVGERTGFV